MMHRKEKAIAEIKGAIKHNCDWKVPDIHRGSIRILLKEYCRRIYLWYKALDRIDDPWQAVYYHCFDVAKYLFGTEVDPDEVEKLVTKDTNMRAHYIDRMPMGWYINYMMYEEEIIEKYGEVAPNPYEVFLVMYKRGAVQMRYSASLLWFEFGGAGVQTRNTDLFDTKVPFIDIKDETALDEMDRLYLENPKDEMFL